MAPNKLSYCARQVRRHDPERYTACLFAPAARREALFALYGFNLEVAKTAEVVSETLIGHIRLQWWRDSLEGIYSGAARAHQVVEPLAAAIRDHGLPRELFEILIDAREGDLERAPPASLDVLVAYAEATSGGLQVLALEILGAAGAAEAAARHVGVAWALIGLLRAVPFHARQRRLYLPDDLCRAAGLEVAGLYELKSSPALCRVVEQVAGRARAHLKAARDERGKVPRQALPALLPARLAERHLARLQAAGHDPFRPSVQSEPTGAAWRLAMAVLGRRY
jgi:NADH dehydrogenase [ubiquinone] 1 alpha subcomplex assembly factor 6